MKLIVGLGNPGSEYADTRHNVGFWVVELLAEKWKVSLSKKKFQSHWGEAQREGEKILLAMPQTYMNLSGKAVAALLGFYKIEPSDLAVIHDDLDLPVGKLKVVREAGPAGNRGVMSIQQELGTKAFCRFRIGVGRPTHKTQTVDFVLGAFSKEEREKLDPILEKTIEGLAIWVKEGVEAAIRHCHRNDSPRSAKTDRA